MSRIELADFLVIAEIEAGIPAEQLARIPRVLQLAEAALAAPYAGFGEVELHPALTEKAAVLLVRIATYHPLPDGNKRTAYTCMRELLFRNDLLFRHQDDDLMKTAEIIEQIAARQITEEQAKQWVADRTNLPSRESVPAHQINAGDEIEFEFSDPIEVEGQEPFMGPISFVVESIEHRGGEVVLHGAGATIFSCSATAAVTRRLQ